MKAVMNWSGGKDSSLALHRMLQKEQAEIACLLTTVNETYKRVSMHGVRVELLEKQAENIGITLKKVWLSETVSMQTYSETMQQTLESLRKENITQSVFGDIFLEDLKIYRETQLAKAGFTGVFPLWKEKSENLMDEFIDLGFKAVIVCVNEKYLDHSFVGRSIDKDFVKDLPAGVDVCGENGEYHSFVFDGPIFRQPIAFEKGEVVYRNYKPVSENNEDNCYQSTSQNWDTGFYYQDLL
jgi:uncharacterized protein (TIGR00290 family)